MIENSSSRKDLARVYNAGLNLLARREHSCKELEQKLVKRFAPRLVQQAINDLRSNGLLSDERFAEALIHARSGKGYGPRYIAQELAQKGIAKELSGELLDERDPQWMARATEVALKKLRTTPRLAEAIRQLDDDDASLEDARERQQQRFQAKQKLSSFLGRRGFSSETVQEQWKLYLCQQLRREMKLQERPPPL